MANVGSDGTDIFLAQNAQLFAKIGSTTTADPSQDAATGDRLVGMRVTRFSKTHPYTRYDHGLQADYGFAAPDVLLSATISASSDLIEDVNALASRDSVGELPEQTWEFILRNKKAKGTNDTQTNRKKVVMTCQVFEFSMSKVDAHPGQPVEAEISMIAKHQAKPSAVSTTDIDRAVEVAGDA